MDGSAFFEKQRQLKAPNIAVKYPLGKLVDGFEKQLDGMKPNLNLTEKTESQSSHLETVRQCVRQILAGAFVTAFIHPPRIQRPEKPYFALYRGNQEVKLPPEPG